jgi:HEPN domain-containing protein
MNADNNLSEWIRLSDMDMATARHMFETYHPKPLEIVCFHSQQAAEKMLKCFLVSQEVEAPKTHDMRNLCDLCIELKEGFNEIYEPAVLLTRYGVIPRYPAELGLIEQDAVEAIEHAEKVIAFVKNTLFTSD